MTSALTTAMLAGVDRLSPTAVVCAGFAGLAVFLTLRHPAGELRRMRLGGSRLAVVTAPCWRLLKGLGDAPPLVRRVVLSIGCALALGFAVARINGSLGGLVWFGVPMIAATGVLALGWFEPRSARRRRERLIMEAPQALELMAACLGAGFSSSAQARRRLGGFSRIIHS